jgi:hypothetical protein
MPTTRAKTSSTKFVVRAKGISDRGPNEGKEIPIVWGMWYGMGGYSQEAWAEGQSGIPFSNAEDAKHIAATLCHGSMWGFKVVPSSAKVFKIDTTTITYVTEQEID